MADRLEGAILRLVRAPLADGKMVVALRPPSGVKRLKRDRASTKQLRAGRPLYGDEGS